MKKNYTDFIIRVYHYKSDYPIMYLNYMTWIRDAVTHVFDMYRKITVKKCKRLSEGEMKDIIHLQLCNIQMIDKEIGEKNFRAGKNVEEPVNVSKFLAKAIYKEQEGKR